MRVKLGENEFEATGASEVVVGQFSAWQRLVAPPQAVTPEPAPPPPDAAVPATKVEPPVEVFAVDAGRRLLSLRLYPAGKTPHADAALLLLYGFHQVLGEEGRAIAATRLKTALAASGHPNARLDRTLARYAANGWIKREGRQKGSTYQLTTSGYQRAEMVARTLRSALAPVPRIETSP